MFCFVGGIDFDIAVFQAAIDMRDLVAPPDKKRLIRVIRKMIGDAVDHEISHDSFVEGSIEFRGSTGNVGVDLAFEPGAVGVDSGILLKPGLPGSCPEMPFANMSRSITGIGQRVRDSSLGKLQRIGESGNTVSGAVLPGQNGCPGRRAD